MRWAFLIFFLTCATYTHFRGRARHGSFFRQIFDHSTFTAPINCFAYLFSKVPNTPYVSPAAFTELAILRANWRVFREEALALEDAKRIQAAEKYNDIGFNSFFRTGWKRFYLKWYDEPHPSASALCPRSVEILQNIPSVKAAMFAMLPAGGSLIRTEIPLQVRCDTILVWLHRTMRAARLWSTGFPTRGVTARMWCSTKPTCTTRQTPLTTIALSFSAILHAQ